MKPPSQRLLYLDWVRGIAAVTMLQGHVFHSFLRNDLRGGGPYMMSQFAGGMPPAVFLFLLGVTFAFLMDSQERKGVQPAGRWLAALRRSGYLFAAAFAFRLQLWLLNCMGLALLALSVMAVFRTVERIRLCAVLGLAIAGASPLISTMNWSWAPTLVRNYVVPDHNWFSFFPWASFVAFGMSGGSIIRRLQPEDVPQTMQWFAWGGLAIAFCAWTLSNTPLSIYSNSDFWLNSPALILIKLGVVLMLIAFAWLWTHQSGARDWSWVRQFGLTSLLVYWVHIELVYGRWLGSLKESLTVGQTALAAFAIIGLMLGLSCMRTNWSSVRAWFSAPAPSRVPGD
jgi:hypothetical protein